MKILRLIDKYLEEFILVPLFTVMVFVIGAQVFMRKVMNSSLSWSEELVRYCFIWLVFIGISYAAKKNRHIRITAIFDQLNPRAQKVLNVLSILIFIAFAAIVVIYGYDVAERILASKQVSPSLQIPMGLVYLASPVGMALTIIRLIQNMFYEYKSEKTNS